MRKKTRGELEAEFTKAIIAQEKDYFGRGPSDARTFLLNDMIVVRLRGILAPAESRLAENPENRELIKETRRRLFETARPMIEEMVREITGCNVVSLHTDMSTKTGERIIVLTVDTDLDKRFD
ncbi:MAG: DUF2294 domain-containing protein [Chloroflexota bacterium]|nr:DUF2294 domain-containing protein [Chloroflexota bacterium]